MAAIFLISLKFGKEETMVVGCTAQAQWLIHGLAVLSPKMAWDLFTHWL